MVLVDAENPQLLLSRGERGLRIVLGVLGDLELAVGNRTLVVEYLGAVELDLGETLVVDGLQIDGKGAGYIGALHLHQQLAFFDEVADAGVDLNYSAGGDGDNGNGARDVGIDRTSELDCRSRRITRRGHKRELFRVVHAHQVYVGVCLDHRGRGSFIFRIGRLTVAACQQIGAETKHNQGMAPETD